MGVLLRQLCSCSNNLCVAACFHQSLPLCCSDCSFFQFRSTVTGRLVRTSSGMPETLTPASACHFSSCLGFKMRDHGAVLFQKASKSLIKKYESITVCNWVWTVFIPQLALWQPQKGCTFTEIVIIAASCVLLMQLLLTENAENNLTSLLKTAGGKPWACCTGSHGQVFSGIKINEFMVLELGRQVLPKSKSQQYPELSTGEFPKGFSAGPAAVSPITVGEWIFELDNCCQGQRLLWQGH